MSLDLEQRLRRDLSTLDEMPLGDDAGITAVAEVATARAARRRRAAVFGAAAALVVAGGAVVWSVNDDPDRVVTNNAATVGSSPDATASTSPSTSPPTTAVAAGPPTGEWYPIAGNPNGVVIDAVIAWTGDAALVVGGRSLEGDPVAGAARYAAGTWEPITAPPPALTTPPRADPLSVWTGTELLVIGGYAWADPSVDATSGLGSPLEDGFAYNPATDSWRTIATEAAHHLHARLPWTWTGTELLVWPETQGTEESVDSNPRAYDPTTDTWRVLPTAPIAPRQQAASVWTGSEWLIWGGTDLGQEFGDGAAYDPVTNTWRPLAGSPLSARRIRGVWTGEQMIVAGGSSGGEPVTGNGELAHSDGAAYDPASDTWRSIATWSAPHPGANPLWTGRYVVMFAKGSAVIYDPAADRWYADCCSQSISAPVVTAAPIWTGTEALTIGASADPAIGGWSLVISESDEAG